MRALGELNGVTDSNRGARVEHFSQSEWNAVPPSSCTTLNLEGFHQNEWHSVMLSTDAAKTFC